jgi:hypothetical protein
MYNVLDIEYAGDWIGVCEGELDTLTMSRLVGIPCVGVPGANSWKKHYTRLLADFERVFGTPTDIDLLEVFKSLGAEVKLVSKISELEQNLGSPKGIKVLVVKINSRKNEAMLRKQIFEEVNRVVKA